MLPTAYVVHQLPGRIRFRVSERRGDAEYFETVRKILSGVPGVERLSVAASTGSIVVHCERATEAIKEAARQAGLFEIAPVRATPVAQSAQRQNSPSVPSMLNLVSNGLAGLALLQVTRGQALGNAAENFWNAYGAARILQRSGLAALFAGVGAYQLLRGRYLGSAASLFFYSMVARQIAAMEQARTNDVKGSTKTLKQHAEGRVAVFPKRSSGV